MILQCRLYPHAWCDWLLTPHCTPKEQPLALWKTHLKRRNRDGPRELHVSPAALPSNSELDTSSDANTRAWVPVAVLVTSSLWLSSQPPAILAMLSVHNTMGPLLSDDTWSKFHSSFTCLVDALLIPQTP